MNEDNFFLLKKIISEEKRIVNEIVSLMENSGKSRSSEEDKIISMQFDRLKKKLSDANSKNNEILEKINLAKPLNKTEVNISKKITENKDLGIGKFKIAELEKETIKRMKKKETEYEKKEEKKPNRYVKISNKFFSKKSLSLLDKEFFRPMKKDLMKANIDILPASYVSVIMFTTMLSLFASLFIFIFLLFFNIGANLPIITFVKENIFIRAVKIIWILIVIPLLTFIIMYFYPSMERKSNEYRLNQELPFATIHMSAISGSMIEPSKIFRIIISTGEYPYLKKEFTKLLNEINVYGFDLVSALRNSALNSPSKKLSELFNGLATTINSGGNLAEFFDKRAQTLLFDYRLEREKYARTAETFMDIYISLVIAAPMIFMLLLMMIKISGLGISLSTGMITLIMVLSVSIINILFLTFLHLKQPSG